MSLASTIVTALLASLFLFAGAIKVLGVDQSLKIRDHLGLTPAQWRAIGVCELLGVACLLVGFAYPPAAIAGAIALGLLGLGAIATHIRAKDSAAEWSAAVVAVALAAAALVLYATT